MNFLPFSYTFLDDIIDIEKDSFPDPWTKGMFLSSAENCHVLFNVLILGKIVVGYYIISLDVEEIEVLKVVVNRHFRNETFGKTLLLNILSVANSKDIKFIFLEVRESNKIALKLYKSCGFIEVGVRKKYYKTEEAIILKLCL